MNSQTEVPFRYQSLYRQLERAVEAFAYRLPDVQTSALCFGAELLPANAHRGLALLRPDTRAGIALYLTALRALGVQGVKVAIGYPILSEDDPHRDAYLAFYRANRTKVGLKHLTDDQPTRRLVLVLIEPRWD